jgi:hypothetical protein
MGFLKYIQDIINELAESRGKAGTEGFYTINVSTAQLPDKEIGLQGSFFACDYLPVGIELYVRFNSIENPIHRFVAGQSLKTPFYRLFITVVGTANQPIVFHYGPAIESQNGIGVIHGPAVPDTIIPATGALSNDNNNGVFGPSYTYNSFVNPAANPILDLDVRGRTVIEIWVQSIGVAQTVNVYSSRDGINWRLVDTVLTGAVTGQFEDGYENAYGFIRVELVEIGVGTSEIEITASR